MFRRKTEIEKIYDAYSRPLFFSAMRILNNSAEAEDAMQESIISWYTSDKKHDIRNLESWLKSSCIRRAIDIIRKREVEKSYKQVVSEESDILQHVDNKENSLSLEDMEESKACRIIKDALASLPDSYRMIVSLHLFEGYDYEEIAEITGLTESGIRSQYMRGRAKLAALSEAILKAEGLR